MREHLKKSMFIRKKQLYRKMCLTYTGRPCCSKSYIACKEQSRRWIQPDHHEHLSSQQPILLTECNSKMSKVRQRTIVEATEENITLRCSYDCLDCQCLHILAAGWVAKCVWNHVPLCDTLACSSLTHALIFVYPAVHLSRWNNRVFHLFFQIRTTVRERII